jgi:hypothetical protein
MGLARWAVDRRRFNLAFSRFGCQTLVPPPIFAQGPTVGPTGQPLTPLPSPLSPLGTRGAMHMSRIVPLGWSDTYTSLADASG